MAFSGDRVSGPRRDGMAAMANTVSGVIVLGLDDNTREIRGIPAEKPDVLARLFQQRSQARLIRFDEQAVPGISVADLNPKYWKRFRTVISKAEIDRQGRRRYHESDG